MSYESEADHHWAREVGYENQDRAWILSDRDAWYPNPFYQGPAVPHPEEPYEDAEETAAYWVEVQDAMEAAGGPVGPFVTMDDEIPF